LVRENSILATANRLWYFHDEHSSICESRQERMDWRHRSACRDEDPELFFPIGNTGPALAQIEEAKKVCARCEVKDPCLQWALESGQEAGVWGGLSEDERRALKRRAARNRARMAELSRMADSSND
jgi:WhiB family redox-sensing transcriptional regulator